MGTNVRNVSTILGMLNCLGSWDESSAIDKVSTFNKKVNPVDSGRIICRYRSLPIISCLFEPISIMFGNRKMECSTKDMFSYWLKKTGEES